MSRQPTQHDYKSEQQIAKYLAYGCGSVLSLLPFHAFLTTWLGSNLGHLDLFRIWKELVIVAFLPFTVYLGLHSPLYLRWLKHSWTVRLIMAYLGLTLLLGALAMVRHKVNGPALAYGLV